MSLLLAADACLSWSLPSITEQQVFPHRLPMQYWLKNHRLSSNTPRTPTAFLIQQSCIIITFFVAKWFVRMRTLKKNGVVKEAIVLQWVVRIASCDFKPGKIKEEEEEEEEEEDFGCLVTFWFGTFAMLFSTTGCCWSWKHSKMNGRVL